MSEKLIIDSEDFKCIICYEIFTEAITDKCGHTFCKICIFTYLKINSKCPLSKIHLKKKNFYPNLIIRKILKKIKNFGKEKKILKKKKDFKLLEDILEKKISLGFIRKILRTNEIDFENLEGKVIKKEIEDYKEYLIGNLITKKINKKNLKKENIYKKLKNERIMKKEVIDFLYFFKFSKFSDKIDFFLISNNNNFFSLKKKSFENKYFDLFFEKKNSKKIELFLNGNFSTFNYCLNFSKDFFKIEKFFISNLYYN